jgi:hypothetical protein
MSKFLQFYPSNRYTRILVIFIISSLLGLILFLLLFNRYSLYFSNVNWIYKTGGDVFQHQIGWEWFRQEPWRFPLGRIEPYGYPFGTYVSYMDSIPFMAFLFKLISPLFTQQIQYFGIWSLLSIIGQLLVGMLILGEFTSSIYNKIIGGSLLVFSQIFLIRFWGHDSLTAQWILLAAIWFIIREYRHKLWRGAWIILFSLATLIQLYFVAMLLPLWAISLFFRYSREKNIWKLLLDLIAVFGILLVVGYSIGLFSLRIIDVGKTTFGYYSWNLNGFINPTYSFIINHQLPTGTEGQYEGYSYLGLGNLLILPFAFILFLKKDLSKRKLFFILPFVFVSILLMLFALTNKAFINAHPLWNFKLPISIYNIFSPLHASGRFIWPVFYFTVLFGIISLVRNTRYATLFLSLALLIQIIDLRLIYSSKRFIGFDEFQSSLQSEFWQAAAKTNQHVFLMWEENAISIYEPLALYARQNNLTLNWGWFSRGNYEDIGNYAIQTWENLKAHLTDDQTMYIFWGSEWEGYAKENLSDFMVICQVDNFMVAVSESNKLIQSPVNLAPYCSFP